MYSSSQSSVSAFTFETDALPPDFNTFQLDDALPDDGDAITDTKIITGLIAGTYSITETLPLGWLVDSIICNAADWTSGGETATVNLAVNETVTCTFTNSVNPTAISLIDLSGNAGGRQPVLLWLSAFALLTGIAVSLYEKYRKQMTD